MGRHSPGGYIHIYIIYVLCVCVCVYKYHVCPSRCATILINILCFYTTGFLRREQLLYSAATAAAQNRLSLRPSVDRVLHVGRYARNREKIKQIISRARRVRARHLQRRRFREFRAGFLI